MLDHLKWAAARARLEALKNNIPNWIDQERVNDYHRIVDALEAASGEEFRDFRIPASEVKPRIASVQRGGFGGEPGRTNYTSKSYCDDGFFRRQVEGLWSYIQVVPQTQRRASSQSEVNYSRLSDDQLQELAVNYRIPPARRVDERGEHFYFDRDKMIEALLERDAASSSRPMLAPASAAKPTNRGRQCAPIFLCHSSQDKESVRQLYTRLSSEGFLVWLDEEALLPGQDWQREIIKAVNASRAVIVCLSQNSVTKTGFVQKEIKVALDAADQKPEGTIFIIPVRLDHCEVPESLRRLHRVDLFSPGGYGKLVQALRFDESRFGQETAATATPPVPITAQCVECGKDLGSERETTLCGFCLGSICESCAPGHCQRLGHPEYPEAT